MLLPWPAEQLAAWRAGKPWPFEACHAYGKPWGELRRELASCGWVVQEQHPLWVHKKLSRLLVIAELGPSKSA